MAIGALNPALGAHSSGSARESAQTRTTARATVAGRHVATPRGTLHVVSWAWRCVCVCVAGGVHRIDLLPVLFRHRRAFRDHAVHHTETRRVAHFKHLQQYCDMHHATDNGEPACRALQTPATRNVQHAADNRQRRVGISRNASARTGALGADNSSGTIAAVDQC